MTSAEIPASESDAWTVAEGEVQGLPSLLRFRPNLKDWLGDPRYTQLLTIYWQYESSNSSGMPDDESSEAMGLFEDTLEAALDSDRMAILAAVRTGSETRSWHFYLRDIETVSQRINQALGPGLPIELEVEDDPDWDFLRNVFRMCGEDLPD
jgi:hypothetical protein